MSKIYQEPEVTQGMQDLEQMRDLSSGHPWIGRRLPSIVWVACSAVLSRGFLGGLFILMATRCGEPVDRLAPTDVRPPTVSAQDEAGPDGTQCNAGNFDCVFGLARTEIKAITHPVSRANAQRTLAVSLAEADLHQQALEAAEALDDDRFYSEAFAAVAASFCRAGAEERCSAVFDRARESARTQANDLNLARSYVSVAYEEIRVGRNDEALKTLERGLSDLLKEDPRSLALKSGLRAVAALIEQHDSEDRAAAIAKLTGQDDPEEIFYIADDEAMSIDQGLKELATAFVYLGRDAEARAIAFLILDPDRRTGALQRIVLAEAREGRLEAAKASAALIETESSAQWARMELLAAQAKAGDLAGAQSTFGSYDFGMHQPIAKAALGAAYRVSGRPNGGAQFLQEAKDSAEGGIPWIRQEVALFASLAGDSAGALKLLQSALDAATDPFEIERTANTMMAIGQEEAAAGALRKANGASSWFGGFGRVAGRLSARGRLNDALAVVGLLSEHEDRAEALCVVGAATAVPQKLLAVPQLPGRVPSHWTRDVFGLPPIE